MYNQSITGDVAMSITGAASDSHHIPCVITKGGTWCIGNGQLHDAMSPWKELCKTLNCMDDPMKIMIVEDDKTFNQISQSAVYREDDISVSITVCGGSYGGGSETLVVARKENDEFPNSNRPFNDKP